MGRRRAVGKNGTRMMLGHTVSTHRRGPGRSAGKPLRAAWAAIFCLMSLGCGLTREVAISGRTMGTTYHIKVVAGYLTRLDTLKQAIEQRLDEVNASMSTFRSDSEISRFNALADTTTYMPVSQGFYRVMETGARLHQLTQGAWDGTVDPLVTLWGFGRVPQDPRVPAAAEIEARRQAVGFHLIDLSRPGHLRKLRSDVSLDLASIAKGDGVDRVAEAIRAHGIENFLVEIGGEVYAGGVRRDGKPWRIGINQPEAGSFDQVYKVVTLGDAAFATSGDYRNFFEVRGRRYSHILDPRSGWPVNNGVVSASVLAPDCTLADGLATALLVLGAEAGLRVVAQLEGVECLVVVQSPDGRLTGYPSSGFQTVD
jgi:thiamine biosynthesis lipoprotein